MSLTPEEKQRIREEEEERAKVQENLKQKNVQSVLKGCLLVIAIPFVFVFVASLFSKPQSETTTTGTEKNESTFDLEVKVLGDCRKAISQEAKYPSKADFYAFGTVTEVKEYVVLMYGSVDFMNAMGTMIPFEYKCKFGRDPYKLISAKAWEKR